MASLLITVLFLGGYLMPFQSLFVEWFGLGGVLLTVIGVLMTLLKTMFIAFCFIWIRWTLPRFKYNQLMNLGWKYMLPISIVNILVIAAMVALWQLFA